MSEVESSGRPVSAPDAPCAVADNPPGWDDSPGAGPVEPTGSDPALRPGLLERLACPVCRGRIALDREALNCSACGRSFPFAGGRLPILFSPASEFADRQEQYKQWRQTSEDRRPRSYRGRRWLPPTSVSGRLKGPWDDFLRSVEGKWVLNAGSGPHLVRSNLKYCVNLDICPHGNVDVIGDAHRLPFADASFDGAIYQAVLAHLRNPFQAAAEIIRVLKPGGLVWCTAPYAHPLSLSPKDFFRFSADGLKAIFDGMTMLELAASGGPFRVISRFAENTAEAIFPGKFGSAAHLTIAWSLQPFKYLDDWLVKRNPACASAFFMLAKKPESPAGGETR
jgi:SAM-dependent methyltransferase